MRSELQQELTTLLGTESRSAWMVFMKKIDVALPILNSSGRPTKTDICNSQIGISGFNSWREMCDSAVQDGGLGWSYNTYKKWKSAFNIVRAHSYLENSDLSASEINTIANFCSRNDLLFPPSQTHLDEVRNNMEQAREERRNHSFAETQRKLTDLSAELTELRTTNTQTSEQNIKLQQRIDDLNVQIGTKQHEIDNLNAEIDGLRRSKQRSEKKIADLNTQIANFTNLSLLQRLKFVFSG